MYFLTVYDGSTEDSYVVDIFSTHEEFYDMKEKYFMELREYYYDLDEFVEVLLFQKKNGRSFGGSITGDVVQDLTTEYGNYLNECNRDNRWKYR